MASKILTHSLFFTNGFSPISTRTSQNTQPFILSTTQPSSKPNHLSTHFNKSKKSFILKCTTSTTEELPIEFRYPAFPTVMDINRIRELLPHRFPFLLVDRVIEHTPGVSTVAIKNVTINDNFFPGHFPERPIMPGVLMVEAMAQVGGLVMVQPETVASGEIFFFAGVDKVRFRKPVVPGDTLVIRMNLVKKLVKGLVKMEGKAYVGADVVCEGEFLLAMGKD